MIEVNHNNVPQAIEVLLNELETVKSTILELSRKNNSKNNPNERLTRDELSSEFKISKGTIHNLMKKGSLRFEKIGHKTLFKREDVENYFTSQSKKLSTNG